AAHMPDLRDGKSHPGRAEIAEDDRADMLGECLEQAELALGELLLYALDDFAVIYRVVDVLGAMRHGMEADLDVHLERLRSLLFPVVDADPGVRAKLPDEDRVQGAPWYAARMTAYLYALGAYLLGSIPFAIL